MEANLEEEKEITDEDPRIRFLALYIIRRYPIKIDKWKKLMATPDYEQCIKDFFDKPEREKLIISMSQAGILSAMPNFPIGGTDKYSFFLKYVPVVITIENLRELIDFGDMIPTAIESAAFNFEHIIGTMFAKSKEIDRYPEATRRELRKRALALRDLGIQLRGQMQGMKILPLPLESQQIEKVYYALMQDGPRKYKVDYELLSTIEKFILVWYDIIHELCIRSGDECFEEDPFCIPNAEIKFWQLRLQHLEQLYRQLADSRVKQIVYILEKTQSHVCPTFIRLFKECLTALSEARDVEKYLRVLVKYIGEIENVDFEESARLFKPLFHVISLVWIHCKSYQYPANIVRLLRMFTNLIIREAFKRLDTTTIFQAEFDETLLILEKVIYNMQVYRSTFQKYQDEEMVKVDSEGVKPKEWKFHHSLIFNGFDEQIERFVKIKDVLVVSLIFDKLERLEIGGFTFMNYQSYLLKKLISKCNKLVKKWITITYDAGDLKELQFEIDYELWKKKIGDYDHRIGYIAKATFIECSNYEQMYKFLDLFSDFIERPIINKMLEPLFVKVLDIFRKEIDDIEKFHMRNLHPWKKDKQVIVPMYWPPVAGAIYWSRTVRDRILKQAKVIDTFSHPLVRSKVDKGLFNWDRSVLDKTLIRLDIIEFKHYSKWRNEVNSIIRKELGKPLFKLNHKCVLKPNFRKKIDMAIKEAKYLTKLGLPDIPRKVLQLAKRSEIFKSWMTQIKELIVWYNSLRTDTRNEEFDVIYDELKGIDKYIDTTIHKFCWGSKDNQYRIARISYRCCFLWMRMVLAQKNLKTIIELANKWNENPLYQRPEGGENPAVLMNCADIEPIRQRYDEIIEVGEDIYDLIENNFMLLHNMEYSLPKSPISEVDSELVYFPKFLKKKETVPSGDWEKVDDEEEMDEGKSLEEKDEGNETAHITDEERKPTVEGEEEIDGEGRVEAGDDEGIAETDHGGKQKMKVKEHKKDDEQFDEVVGEVSDIGRVEEDVGDFIATSEREEQIVPVFVEDIDVGHNAINSKEAAQEKESTIPDVYKEFGARLEVPPSDRSNPLLSKSRELRTATALSSEVEKSEHSSTDIEKPIPYLHLYLFAEAINNDWRETRPTPRPTIPKFTSVPGLRRRDSDIESKFLDDEWNEEDVLEYIEKLQTEKRVEYGDEEQLTGEDAAEDTDNIEAVEYFDTEAEEYFDGPFSAEDLLNGKQPKDVLLYLKKFLANYDRLDDLDITTDVENELLALKYYDVIQGGRHSIEETEEGGVGKEEENEDDEEEKGTEHLDEAAIWVEIDKFIDNRCQMFKEKFWDDRKFIAKPVVPYDSVTSMFSLDLLLVKPVTSIQQSQETETKLEPDTEGSFDTSSTPGSVTSSSWSFISQLNPSEFSVVTDEELLALSKDRPYELILSDLEVSSDSSKLGVNSDDDDSNDGVGDDDDDEAEDDVKDEEVEFQEKLEELPMTSASHTSSSSGQTYSDIEPNLAGGSLSPMSYSSSVLSSKSTTPTPLSRPDSTEQDTTSSVSPSVPLATSTDSALGTSTAADIDGTLDKQEEKLGEEDYYDKRVEAEDAKVKEKRKLAVAALKGDKFENVKEGKVKEGEKIVGEMVDEEESSSDEFDFSSEYESVEFQEFDQTEFESEGGEGEEDGEGKEGGRMEDGDESISQSTKESTMNTVSLCSIFRHFSKNPVKRGRWDRYIEMIDNFVKYGLLNAVGISIAYLIAEMHNDNNNGPLFEVKLKVVDSKLTHVPTLIDDENAEGSFLCLISTIIKNINAIGLLIPRISYFQKKKTYMDEILAEEKIRDLEEKMILIARLAMLTAKKYSNHFERFSYLWTENKEISLRQFLKFGRILLPEEAALEDAEDEDGERVIPLNEPNLNDFKTKIDYYEEIYNDLLRLKEEEIIDDWFCLSYRTFKKQVLNFSASWAMLFKQYIIDQVVETIVTFDRFVSAASIGLSKGLIKGDYEGLVKIMGYLRAIEEYKIKALHFFSTIDETMELLKNYGHVFPVELQNIFKKLSKRWEKLKKKANEVRILVEPLIIAESNTIKKRLSLFEVRLELFMNEFKKKPFWLFGTPDPYYEIDKSNMEIKHLEDLKEKLVGQANLFEVEVEEMPLMLQLRKEIKLLKIVWDYVNIISSMISDWELTKWKSIDSESMDMDLKRLTKELKTIDKLVRNWDIYIAIENMAKNLITALRAITELQNPAMKFRHWEEIMSEIKAKLEITDNTTLKDLISLALHKYEDEVKTVVDKAVKELQIEKLLHELATVWAAVEFEYEPHLRSGLKTLRVSEENVEMLEEHQVQVQNMLSSKFIGYYFKEVSEWQKKLSNAEAMVTTWSEVQRIWKYLESIFTESEDIRRTLPEDTKLFDQSNASFRTMMKAMQTIPNVLIAANQPNIIDNLNILLNNLQKCEKALTNYLDTKKLIFPRFYFLSNHDLMDILANSMIPENVCRHLSKLYDSMSDLKFKKVDGKNTKTAIGMYAKDGEYVDMYGTCECVGAVENWLNSLTEAQCRTVRNYFHRALLAYELKARHEWVFDWPAQAAMVTVQIMWSVEVTFAFKKLEEGHENSMKEYQKKQIYLLTQLINLMLGELTEDQRMMITAICTIEVHSRDIVAKMIATKIGRSGEFQWQSQLRHRWDHKSDDCFINICDAQFLYQYEYFGNQPRLVITPLTDRCYITLTQSLHLIMGGAPAGPAGTGKTETTKDLSKSLGIMIYVFNCSEQMDYRSIGNIYKGLSQTGAWGCFDEFNRISVEVLSVVAVQVKAVLDAIKSKKTMFNFQGEMIRIIATVGMFITMNPGYAGRAELPENLKALFRPCAMVVPDFDLICENMLIGEAFQEARVLGKKFITLYELCKELLSKQDHYDWGLRAIKSVLRVAGSLRRGDKDRPEEQVLMRALRDFNLPKIVTDDRGIFMGLIGDLFPALDVPRKRDLTFEKLVYQAALDMKLQPEDGFVLKIVQLVELFAVRHSVFIIGDAGTGKSMVWKTLHKTYANMKLKPHYNDLEPKAVTNNELFGIINPSTREWRDGIFSVLLRDQANMTGTGPKWMVMDGDIDPMWIESLNTVMDDNKVLTLASNERIALTASMRLLFEISNLRTATPATVSRAGILFINPTDLGWTPYVKSWMQKTRDIKIRAILEGFFEKYVPHTLLASKKVWRIITPIPETAHVHVLCTLLELLLTPNNVPKDCPKEWYETYFVFAMIWAFGSPCHLDQVGDNRILFSNWWVAEFKTIRFPDSVAKGETTVFHYYIDEETKIFSPWTDMVVPYALDYETPLQQTLVSTAETTRVRYFLDLLIEKKKPVMLISPAGCGKSVLIGEKMSSLSEDYAVTNIAFNFYTTSEMLQKVLEKPLEKKSGRNFGPVGNKTMIYFMDDMNMPEVDKYGTVQPHCLIRQHMDYQHWYDRQKLSVKDIHNIMFVSCMNPTAGSFTIDSRLQRHFAVFALSFPTEDSLKAIYSTVLSQHFQNPNYKFKLGVKTFVEKLMSTAVAVHYRMQAEFLPTAIKFHYIFNLRDFSNIFQALLMTGSDCMASPGTLLRVWIHEASRVYSDKLISLQDQDRFQKILISTVRQKLPEISEADYMRQPRLYCHFAEGIGDPKYMEVASWSSLHRLLTEAMEQYTDLIANMNLVLFEDAMSHVCRINRVMEMPRGNALLVGVGGSGKQSLSRLSAFISSLEVFQLQLTSGYSVLDLKADLAGIYIKAGLKNVGMMFLMTDSQVPDERFLVLINDMLSSGEIPELFVDDELEAIINTVLPEVKSVGLSDTKENCWHFFINRVRHNLKTILCFSPVGSTLRVRSRKFPAIVNCTTIDWFMEWPQSALESVSLRLLRDLEELPDQYKLPMSLLMAYMHTSVNIMSENYKNNEKRFNYTTPKSFLELINLYSKLLASKNDEINLTIGRLENGLEKLESCSEQVSGLKEQLAIQSVILIEKNKKASELIQVVASDTEVVSKEKKIAKEEERKCQIIEEDVKVKQKVCEEDLAKAMPALEAAQEALNTLNKTNLTEMRSFGTPPEAVANVAAAVMVLLAKKGKIPKDRSWKASKVMMGSADSFLSTLVNYKKENIHPEIVKAIKPYIKDPEFLPEKVITKSSAAAGLCAWVINIMKFHEVWLVVLPKKKAEAAARAELAASRAQLAALDEKIKMLEAKLSILTEKFEIALNEQRICQAEEDKTRQAIDLANRLVNGLSSENIRWRETVKILNTQLTTLPGDVILVTAFISYAGCFMRKYREELMERNWIPRLSFYKPNIPYTNGIDPLLMLTDDAQVAAWNNEGLPNDRMSTENATILMSSERWPLMIDPQLQGIKWIKNKYGKELQVIRLGQKHYLDKMEKAVSEGRVMLMEYIGETIDPVLENLLSRNLIRKGKVLKIGDREIDYNLKFRLILQTKLANPHYQPEIQAQTTLINFTVTRDGLEDQLLAEVVKAERPDLEKQKSTLTKQQNNFKIQLKILEDELLQRLSAAGPDILSDRVLVENLESTKRTAENIALKVEESKITSFKIDNAREIYRTIATRASVLYFILNDLNKINLLYQFSLKAFSTVFHRAIAASIASTVMEQRVINLIDNITYNVFMYTSRGLFECDKLIFLCQLTIQILVFRQDMVKNELDFLLKFPYKPNVKSPVPFLTDISWGGVEALCEMPDFKHLNKDIESAVDRWAKFVNGETPEREKFPQDWSNKTNFQQLLLIRTLRPDRMSYALRIYAEIILGEKFASARTILFEKSYEETTATTAVFFILSPGVDPTNDVERLGKKLGFTTDLKNFHNVSLGQGQESVAENAIEVSSKSGHWVILQNIHLVANWLPILDKKMEKAQENPHSSFRLFLSSEPPPDPTICLIPQGVLESSIKITNEPPAGMMANLHKALDNFNQATLDMCSKETEFKAILFALCYFHAVVAERRKFGPQGWNRTYPFNVGDLTISVMVLKNYLENNITVPWVDLRYLFGEIMYGGHITDDRDRRLCRTYLEEYLQPSLVEGELEYAPGFTSPPNSDYTGYHNYVDAMLPTESPVLYGLHLNAEIGFLTTQADKLFKTLVELQPREGGEDKGGGPTREEKVTAVLDKIMAKVRTQFVMGEVAARMPEQTPYNIVALQECERMNILTALMLRSLKELKLGLQGELTITSDMENLEACIFNDVVPPNWTAHAYPSEHGLSAWFADLVLRITELESWTSAFQLPEAVWLGGLFNPNSFLTAIMQMTARKNEWPLDKMCLQYDVLKKKDREDVAAPKEGANLCNLYMEGARWDMNGNTIAEANLKDMFPMMPIIFVKAITQDKLDLRGTYECPVYKTRLRGPTYVQSFHLKTRSRPSKWILAGVGLLLTI